MKLQQIHGIFPWGVSHLASGEDGDNANPDLHSPLRIEVPTHAHLPTWMVHLRCGGQCVPALLLSGNAVTLT